MVCGGLKKKVPSAIRITHPPGKVSVLKYQQGRNGLRQANILYYQPTL